MSDPAQASSAEPAPAGARILIVDDDQPMAAGLKALVEKEGHRADTVASAEQALARLDDETYALILSDVKMPGLSGLELLDEVQRRDPQLPVVLLTGFATVANAVEAIRRGAFDYIPKPFKLDEVRIVVRRALERGALVQEVSFLRSQVVRKFSFGEVVAGAAFRKVLELAEKVAPARTSVLITGETGTGKELVAKALHFASPRKDRPFLTVNCSALAPGVIESELFGHARGAFTGAVEARPGYFQAADGGTLFLDEVGEIEPSLQAKLLRVLQEGTYQRVGETRTRSVDVRVLAATHRDLEEAMRTGRFREDLYYRLAVVNLKLPALRERRHDIQALAEHFLARFARELGKPTRVIPEPVLAALLKYRWPGNVRELENAVERGVLLSDGEELSAAALPADAQPLSVASARSAAAAAEPDTTPVDPAELVTLAANEKAHIERALAATGNNKNLAAKLLGITRRSLYRKLDKHGLKP